MSERHYSLRNMKRDSRKDIPYSVIPEPTENLKIKLAFPGKESQLEAQNYFLSLEEFTRDYNNKNMNFGVFSFSYSLKGVPLANSKQLKPNSKNVRTTTRKLHRHLSSFWKYCLQLPQQPAWSSGRAAGSQTHFQSGSPAGQRITIEKEARFVAKTQIFLKEKEKLSPQFCAPHFYRC